MPNTQGLSVIKTFNALQKNSTDKIVLPSSFRSLNSQYNKHPLQKEIKLADITTHDHDEIFTIFTYEYFLDKDFFPSLQNKKRKLLLTTSLKILVKLC